LGNSQNNRWSGLNPAAINYLNTRDYLEKSKDFCFSGDAGQFLQKIKETPEFYTEAWISGVDLFPRMVHRQRMRGTFSELGRQGDGLLGKIGFWPKQWSISRMYAASPKGIHIHPPYLPEEANESPGDYFQRIYGGGGMP